MIATRLLVIPLLAGATLLGACVGDKAGTADVAGLPTVFDSTGDTIRARVVGAVDSADIRTLVAEARIAGEIGDGILFADAGDLTLSPSGALALHDYSSTQLLLFAPDGSLIGRMGGKGGGPGEYQDVNGLAAVDDSTWAVYDASSSRVSFFGTDGAFRDSWNVPSTRMIGSNMLVTDSSRSLRLSQFVLPPSGDFMAASFGYARVVTGGTGLVDTSVAPTLRLPILAPWW